MMSENLPAALQGVHWVTVGISFASAGLAAVLGQFGGHLLVLWRENVARANAFQHYIGDLHQLSIEFPDLHLEALNRLKREREPLLPPKLCRAVFVLLHKMQVYQVERGRGDHHRIQTSTEAFQKLQSWLHQLTVIAEEWAEQKKTEPADLAKKLERVTSDGLDSIKPSTKYATLPRSKSAS